MSLAEPVFRGNVRYGAGMTMRSEKYDSQGADDVTYFVNYFVT
jgi:hypothetical protein